MLDASNVLNILVLCVILWVCFFWPCGCCPCCFCPSRIRRSARNEREVVAESLCSIYSLDHLNPSPGATDISAYDSRQQDLEHGCNYSVASSDAAAAVEDTTQTILNESSMSRSRTEHEQATTGENNNLDDQV